MSGTCKIQNMYGTTWEEYDKFCCMSDNSLILSISQPRSQHNEAYIALPGLFSSYGLPIINRNEPLELKLETLFEVNCESYSFVLSFFCDSVVFGAVNAFHSSLIIKPGTPLFQRKTLSGVVLGKDCKGSYCIGAPSEYTHVFGLSEYNITMTNDFSECSPYEGSTFFHSYIDPEKKCLDISVSEKGILIQTLDNKHEMISQEINVVKLGGWMNLTKPSSWLYTEKYFGVSAAY